MSGYRQNKPSSEFSFGPVLLVFAIIPLFWWFVRGDKNKQADKVESSQQQYAR